MYSFARRYYNTPLYGGFVKEYSKRFIVNGNNASIAICQIPVTGEQYQAIRELLSTMYQNKEDYLYNHISAMGAMLHKSIRAKNAYTCIEFCLSVLQMAGQPFEKNKYYSIGDVWSRYHDQCIYEGPMPETPDGDSAFFAKKPVAHPISVTLRDICRLLPRIRQARLSSPANN